MGYSEKRKLDIGRYLLIGFILLLILGMLNFARISCKTMVQKNAVLVDALMEIKLDLTTAHLWLEEVLSGDRHESIDKVNDHLEKAKWYANAVLSGGENTEGNFFPIEDTSLRKAMGEILQLIDDFSQLTTKRFQALSTSGIGSEVDIEYDNLFEKIIRSTDEIETLMQRRIENGLTRFDMIQLFLLALIISLGSISLFIQFRFEKEQRRYISDIHKEQKKTQESENWLKTTMNSMGDGVIITDHLGNVEYLNPVASVLTGWRTNDAKGKKMTEVFTIVNEITKKPVEDPVNLVIKRNMVVGLANHTELISKEGKVWPISDSAAPIFDSDNNLIGIVVVFHEVSSQKKAEKEKAYLEAQLHQAAKMEAIGTLAGGIAHDFNNILAIILGNAELALNDISNGHPSRECLSEIQEASARARDLVNNILSFSRQKASVREPASLQNLVTEIVKSLSATIPSSVKKIIDVDGSGQDQSKTMMIYADKTKIHQVLLNLCINAVQAMDEKGTLKICVDEIALSGPLAPDIHQPQIEPGTYSVLRVTDTGEGIPEDIIKKIFDPFFTTKEVGRGTGMGLSVVHGIVEEHGGKIHVGSVLGKGTTFSIYFPSFEFNLVEKEDEPFELPVGSENILVVDDEKMVARLHKRMLEVLGYHVTAMSDSQQALEFFQANGSMLDLILTDQTMPNLTGIEFAEKCREIRPDISIILCTGYSSKVDKEKSQRLGIFEFISKPIEKKELASIVRRVLDTQCNQQD